jgi:hypothetical protein
MSAGDVLWRPGTAAADRERFIGSSAAVVAIESAWFERMRSCRLFCYHLPAKTFECHDKTAGYLVSRAAVKPARVDVLHDPVLAILQRGVELRVCRICGHYGMPSSNRRWSSRSFAGTTHRLDGGL